MKESAGKIAPRTSELDGVEVTAVGATALNRRILVVDDEDTVRMVVRQVLEDDGHEVAEAANAERGLELFRQEPFAVVITDIYMGKMNGLDLLNEIKLLDPDSIVVLMTSNASLETAASAVRSGAYDYLMKPFDDIDVISAVAKRALEQHRLVQENRSLMNSLKQNGAVLQKLNGKLQEMASRDGLTGLYNHRFFRDALEAEIHRGSRYGRTFSLIFLDIDHFKQYNDTNGHLAGDALLKGLGKLLLKSSRRSGVICRYGGEEFIIIAPEADRAGALQYAEILRRTVEEHPFVHVASQPHGAVTVSVGVASFPQDGTDGTGLIDHADQALYRAKHEGRNRVRSCDQVKSGKSG